ncbi:MAG: SdrD B-like domain-containing protein [Thiotrichaceae bacterium]
MLGLNGERRVPVLADSKYAAAGSAVADIGIASAVANTVFQPASGGLTVNVFHDRNISGAKDAANEENLSGIKVTVHDSKNKVKGTGTTDANGLVNIAGLANDTYKWFIPYLPIR